MISASHMPMPISRADGCRVSASIELAIGPGEQQPGEHRERRAPAEIEQGLGRDIFGDARLQLGGTVGIVGVCTKLK